MRCGSAPDAFTLSQSIPQNLSLDQVPPVLFQFLITYLICTARNSILGSNSLSEAFNCGQSFGPFDNSRSYILLAAKSRTSAPFFLKIHRLRQSDSSSYEWVEIFLRLHFSFFLECMHVSIGLSSMPCCLSRPMDSLWKTPTWQLYSMLTYPPVQLCMVPLALDSLSHLCRSPSLQAQRGCAR